MSFSSSSISTEFSINEVGKFILTVFEVFSDFIEITSVSKRNNEITTRPKLIKINKVKVFEEIVFEFVFFDVKTVFFFNLLVLFFFKFAKSFIPLHFLHWGYSKNI